MNCNHVKELLFTDYRDGACTPEIATEIKKHLADCSECRALHETLDDLSPKTVVTPVMPPPEVWERITRTIEQESPVTALPQSGIFSRIIVPFITAAAAALLIYIAAPSLNNGDTISDTPAIVAEESFDTYTQSYIISGDEYAEDVSFDTAIETLLL